MLTSSFLRGLEGQLGKTLKQKLHFKRVSPISGGSINQAARLDTTYGTFFLKANDTFLYPKMFEKETHGLKILKETNLITIPDIILIGEEEGLAFMVLRFIDSKPRNINFWESLGTSLAKIHRHTSQRFGFTEDNYIGSLFQSNKEYNRWTDFFTEERLEKQVQLALSTGRMNESDRNLFSKIYSRYETIAVEEQPALLHGDLWSGNLVTGTNGEPCLVDPAVYFGHREMDISMSRLFGGFEEEFYHAYNNEYPLMAGFEERMDIHNLYPLMVHLNLFGGSYLHQVRSILKRFV